MSDQLVDYAVQVVRRTRTDDAMLVGAGPRASQALLRAARAWAALSGRDFVSPDDIRAVAAAGAGTPPAAAPRIGTGRRAHRRSARPHSARGAGAAMIVPSQRLMLLAAVVVVPLATAAGFVPGAGARLASSTLALCAVVAAVDAVRGRAAPGRARLRSARLSAPHQGRPGAFAHHHRQPLAATPRASGSASLCPPGVASASLVEETVVPAGTSRFDWPCHRHRARRSSARALCIWKRRRPSVCGWPAPRAAWIAPCASIPTCATAPPPRSSCEPPMPGLRMRRQVGKGREFDNLRQYMPGDSFEDIDWKATARRQFPGGQALPRGACPGSLCRGRCVAPLRARTTFWKATSTPRCTWRWWPRRRATASAWSPSATAPTSSCARASGMDHFRLCRETIYNLQASRVSPDFRDVFTTLQLNLRRRALLVFFTSLDDALLAETFEREISLLARRHVVLVNVAAAARH